MPTATRRRIIVFLVLTYALSSIFYVQILSSGKMKETKRVVCALSVNGV